MTTPPAPASQPDGDADRVRRRQSDDRAPTIILLIVLFVLMCVLAALPLMSLHNWTCISSPGRCDEALLAFANFMGTPALLIIFLASTVISIVLQVRQRRAFYVPLIGAAAMIGCFVVWLTLVRRGFGLRSPCTPSDCPWRTDVDTLGFATIAAGLVPSM